MTTYEPESAWLLKLGVLYKGTYVDLGCSHPTNKSLTHFVRDLGWNGVAVDGNKDYWNDWNDVGFAHHFFHAVLSSQPRARFVIHDNSFTSRLSVDEQDDHPENWGIKRVEEVATIPLNDILIQRNIGKIDLLTIDLEGAEFDVLQTLDFEKHSPSFIVSEYVTHGENTDPRVFNFLIAKGYRAIHMTASKIIYQK